MSLLLCLRRFRKGGEKEKGGAQWTEMEEEVRREKQRISGRERVGRTGKADG